MPGTEENTAEYGALISRALDRPEAGLWPFRLRERLPVIPIPLRSADGDACLDLQVVPGRCGVSRAVPVPAVRTPEWNDRDILKRVDNPEDGRRTIGSRQREEVSDSPPP